MVPIPYNLKNLTDLDFLLDRVNGILMPGGDASLWYNETTKDEFSNMTLVGQYSESIINNFFILEFGSYDIFSTKHKNITKMVILSRYGQPACPMK